MILVKSKCIHSQCYELGLSQKNNLIKAKEEFTHLQIVVIHQIDYFIFNEQQLHFTHPKPSRLGLFES
jgi:hypothetical protein